MIYMYFLVLDYTDCRLQEIMHVCADDVVLLLKFEFFAAKEKMALKLSAVVK